MFSLKEINALESRPMEWQSAMKSYRWRTLDEEGGGGGVGGCGGEKVYPTLVRCHQFADPPELNIHSRIKTSLSLNNIRTSDLTEFCEKSPRDLRKD